MKKRLRYLILPVVTLLLELLPYGAVCNFANPEGEPWRETYSYFSLLPFGYANFAPLLTALVSCAVLIVLLLFCFRGTPRSLKAAKILLGIGVLLSLCPLLPGLRYFSLVGALITASLLAELLVLYFPIG